MPVSIMLDAGHGGRDPGAVYNGRQEKDDVLKLVLAIGEILQNSGIDVEYTRTTDIYETPFQKATEANEAGVDFFISIHRNSSPLANQYMGVESLIYNLSGIKYEMAENINAQLETVGFKDLGVKARPNLVVLRRTKMYVGTFACHMPGYGKNDPLLARGARCGIRRIPYFRGRSGCDHALRRTGNLFQGNPAGQGAAIRPGRLRACGGVCAASRDQRGILGQGLWLYAGVHARQSEPRRLRPRP